MKLACEELYSVYRTSFVELYYGCFDTIFLIVMS